MDVRNDTSSSNCSLDEPVEFLVSSDSQLEMSWCDSLHLEVLGCVSSKLKNFGCQVLEDGSTVDCSSCSNSLLSRHSSLDESVDSTDWELMLRTLT